MPQLRGLPERIGMCLGNSHLHVLAIVLGKLPMSVCVSNRIGAAKHLSVVALALAVAGCGSHTTIYQNYYSDPGGSGGASASPAHAGASASAGQASIGGV